MWAICIGVLAGLIVAGLTNYHIPVAYSLYVAVGVLAALDTVFGGLAATLSKNFSMRIFISGFIFNSLIAVALVYLGKLLGIDLTLAAIVVFGSRIFQNFATIRRLLLNKLTDKNRIQLNNE